MAHRIFMTDHIALTSRVITPQGFLMAPGVISRSGVFPYKASELELADRPPHTIVKVYRSFDETAKAVGSFDNVPITMEHPRGGINASTWRQLAVGDVRSPIMSGNDVSATLTVRDQKAIDAITHGRRHLSCGYDFELVPQSGKTDAGEEYEFAQVSISGNHVAVVDSPRCGPQCRIGDSDTGDRGPSPAPPREEPKKMQLILNGMIFEVSDQNLVTQIQALQSKVATLEKQSSDFQHAVSDRQKVVSMSGTMLPGFQVSDSLQTNEVRRAVLEKLMSTNSDVKQMIGSSLRGKTLGDADPEVLATVFDLVAHSIAAAKQKGNERARQIGQDVLGAGRYGDPQFIRTAKDAEQALSGRDLWTWRITHPESFSANAEEL